MILFQAMKTIAKKYQITNKTKIEELSIELIELVHTETGAKVMHLKNADPENLFCLSFQTLPDSSNGVAHILEHTVLCGSEKFDVKDPFFSMLRRSLNTYMNALTGSDFTCYPAASMVEKDFYNLLEVYLDAVFHPNLKELSFLQEGHRYALEDPEDLSSNLLYKGIVFNEMKGALSSPDSRLWEAVFASLYPDLELGHNSGGTPQEIPNLSYQGLLDFHKKFYHPSHCLFFFYGNLPTEKHLEFLSENILDKTEKADPITPLQKQKRFQNPTRLEAFYPSSEKDLEKLVIQAFSFLTCESKNQEDTLALSVLDIILMDNDASPLKHALLASSLCNQADGVIDPEMKEIPYVIVLKGTKASSEEKIKEIIFTTLKTLVEKGIDQEKIDAAIHQLEFSRSEIAADYGPFGLTLFMRSALMKQHGANPEDALRTHSLFKTFKEKAKNKDYFPNLINKYFLKNPHFTTVILKPDNELENRENTEEQKKLAEIKKTFSTEDLKRINSVNEELEIFQEREENLSCLPSLKISDIPKQTPDYPLSISVLENAKVFHHACFTNHITYVDVIFDLPKLSEKQLPYLSLFNYLFTELGCKDLTYIQSLERQQRHTGGIYTNVSLFEVTGKPDEMKPTFSMRGKSLEANTSILFSYMIDFLTGVRFDEKDRIKELIMQLYTGMQNRINQNGLKYAALLAQSSLSSNNYTSHLLRGLPYYHFIKDLALNIDTKLDKVIEELSSIKDSILHLSAPDIVISSSDEAFREIEKNNFYGMTDLPKKPFTPWVSLQKPKKETSKGVQIATPVSFNSRAYKTVSIPHEDTAALCIASSLFDHKVLHKSIREKGGAYGGGSQYHSSQGIFSFYSYRDPHINSSLKAFSASIESIAKGNFTNLDIDEAILSIIQNHDTPVSPGSRAMLSYTYLRVEKSKELRQKFRDDLLSMNKSHIEKAVSSHLLEKEEDAITISFSGKELLKKEKILPIIEI